MSAEDGTHKKKKKKRRSTDTSSATAPDSTDFPEDPEGGLYGPDRPTAAEHNGPTKDTTGDDVVFNHEF